jgi:hypothetical protein
MRDRSQFETLAQAADVSHVEQHSFVEDALAAKVRPQPVEVTVHFM